MVKGIFTQSERSFWNSFSDIEKRAQSFWKANKTDATLPADDSDAKYILGMFPYPSGNAHMGHARVYTLTDVQARMARFQGHAVLHPLGWDSFGLPAENAAFQNNVHPEKWTNQNIASMRDEQLSRIGISFDLEREIATSSPEYYKWTQWLFLKLYESGMVERRDEWVNWDPVDQTVLANEQVVDGKGWRSGAPVERRKMEQWYIRITDYAEDLWNGLNDLPDWPDTAIAAQRNWIGRSQGAEISFKLPGDEDKNINVFTTRPDTIYGVTSIVLAPESSIVQELDIPADKKQAVEDYIKESINLSDIDRQTQKTKTGVDTGITVEHPLTGESIPVFLANYVIASHGTGAVMNVPAHDQRDFEFAIKYGLPITQVISVDGNAAAKLDSAYTGAGQMINSAEFDGMANTDFMSAAIDKLQSLNKGGAKTHFRLRDWSVSRQRFWGAPIPMLKDDQGNVRPVPESELPIKLPHDVDFNLAGGKSPLATSPNFYEYEDPQSGEKLLREVDTMDTFMCSAWYIWRFLDPKNKAKAWRSEEADKWMPVDVYVGGLEHANQHLIYLRFMSHFLHKKGLTPTKEPIVKFQANGMVKLDGSKMSKSKGNVVRPDDMIDIYGADALRMYILSDTPYDRDIDWNEDGIKAKQAFLGRVFSFYQQHAKAFPAGVHDFPDDVEEQWSKELLRELFDASNKVEQEIAQNSNFHLAVTQLHVFYNSLSKKATEASQNPERQRVFAYAAQNYLKMLGVVAPHTAEVIWQDSFDLDTSLFAYPWVNTDHDLKLSADQTVEIPVMINGKKRGNVLVPVNDNDQAIIDSVLKIKENGLAKYFQDVTVKRSILVRQPDQTPKLLNLVLVKTGGEPT